MLVLVPAFAKEMVKKQGYVKMVLVQYMVGGPHGWNGRLVLNNVLVVPKIDNVIVTIPCLHLVEMIVKVSVKRSYHVTLTLVMAQVCVYKTRSMISR